MAVKMYGPSLDGAGPVVNREVPDLDVAAYERAGYKKGWIEGAPTAQEYAGSKPQAKVENESDESVDLSKMTKQELLDHADAHSVGTDSSMTKADIIAAIEGAE